MFVSYVEQVSTIDPRNKKLHQSVADGWEAACHAVKSYPAFYQAGIALTPRKCSDRYENGRFQSILADVFYPRSTGLQMSFF